jgi:hypothetical protein
MPPKRKREPEVAASGVAVKREAVAENSVSSDRHFTTLPNAASELDIQDNVDTLCGLPTGALLALAVGVGSRMSAILTSQKPVEGQSNAVIARILRNCVPAVAEAVCMLTALERLLQEHLLGVAASNGYSVTVAYASESQTQART